MSLLDISCGPDCRAWMRRVPQMAWSSINDYQNPHMATNESVIIRSKLNYTSTPNLHSSILAMLISMENFISLLKECIKEQMAIALPNTKGSEGGSYFQSHWYVLDISPKHSTHQLPSTAIDQITHASPIKCQFCNYSAESWIFCTLWQQSHCCVKGLPKSCSLLCICISPRL